MPHCPTLDGHARVKKLSSCSNKMSKKISKNVVVKENVGVV